MSLVDGKERELATNPTGSYIVQAPAGSGKTEVLTQRYLRLLNTVNKPEEIISITFTKKAANEMRERILSALLLAKSGEKPSAPHQLNTYNYAKAALQRSEQLNWNITEQPHSLKVITIDSLCQMLANAIYIQESKTAFAQICESPEEIYQQTARDCLSYAAGEPSYQTSLIELLQHLDNRQDNLQKLLTDLLTSRDTWLEQLYTAKAQSKEDFERAIQALEKKAIQNFCESLPLELEFQLINLINRLFVATDRSTSKLTEITNFTELTTETAASLCSVLLTSSNSLRKAFDHHVGLKKSSCEAQEYQALKAESKELLATLVELPSFTNALLNIKDLPNPTYADQQWQILQALFKLMPLLVAHLELNFQTTNQVDFTGIATEALNALGEELEPTNLALYLDNAIRHILIDEFQDTSLKQFQLITKLVQGWEENDGRTLFVVGDPQQSIYRFRGAEVGLFLKAKMQGVANIKLTPLNLTCNFRSKTTIVEWVNKNFKTIFPQQNDINSGAITYTDSVPTQEFTEQSFIKAAEYPDADSEAEFIVETVINEQQLHPDASIAILVRSRKQLSVIMQKIRQHGISYQGVDIDLLAKQSHIRDVYSLTKTLLMPGDRLAWLSLFRSSLCGLCLEDILKIAEFAPKKSIFYTLSKLESINTLSKGGQQRAAYLFKVLSSALQNRLQSNVVDWLLNTLETLHADAIYTETQLQDLNQYWQLLDKFLVAGDIENWQLFTEQLNNLYAKQTTVSNLQIMTIHKSKGLEFDCVIAPGLGTKSQNIDSQLFKILNLPDEEEQDLLLFSPIKAASADSCNLYNYIKKVDDQKSVYELQRLLYVAVTRAKQRLYLTDSQGKSSKTSLRKFLCDVEFTTFENSNITEQVETSTLPILMHLPTEYYNKTPQLPAAAYNKAEFNPIDDDARLLGVATHEVLQWLCENFKSEFTDIPEQIFENTLLKHGFLGQDLENSLKTIKSQIQNLYQDPIGLWIISPHKNARNEYELIVKEEDGIKTRILDRAFTDNDSFWIIDFKTGNFNSESHAKYIKQVDEYANLLQANYRQIKCGIYYLSNNSWHTWNYKLQTTKNAPEEIDI